VAWFVDWMEHHATERDAAVEGLVYAYYDTDKQRPWFLSTMVSADVARFYLQAGDQTRARAIGDGLLRWQHDGSGRFGERLGGAFPSELHKEGTEWVAKPYYASSDNLTVIEALLDLSEATSDPRYLDAAKRSGVWLRDVMSHGELYGVWAQPHGAPMHAVTASGDFDNRIGVGRTLFWLPTLHRLAAMTGESSFAQMAEQAEAFLAHGQHPSGGFHDHYDPGYPALPFDQNRFRAYGPDGAVVADDSIRASLGMVFAGNHESSARFAKWLSHRQGRVTGYIGIETGKPRFTPRDRVYYDIVSSGLLGALLGRLDVEHADTTDFLLNTQAENGGWYWGWDEQTDRPLTATQSTLTGLWALLDLSPRAHALQ
jgi:hypothetical protein